MVDNGWSLPENPVFELRNIDGVGRGVFARTDLAANAHILTTSPAFSPIAHVVLRQYRREVCASCFAYDRGRDWKFRIPQTSLSFCSPDCLKHWTQVNPDVHIEALQLVKASTQRQKSHHDDHMVIDSDRQLTWQEAEAVEEHIVNARFATTPSKAERKLLASHGQAIVDPDIVSFLLAGCFMLHSQGDSTNSALLALADNPRVYETASLSEHTKAYLLLLTILPLSLLQHLRPTVCHELISRASHNAFSIRPSSDGPESGEFLGYGVWPEASFFNHSCSPNVSKKRNRTQWSFHASRDVLASEELCITYLGGDEECLDVRGRRKRLQDEWGFLCHCWKCMDESRECGP